MIDFLNVFDNRMQATKSHGLGEFENGLASVHQTPVPVLFQNAPNPLNRIIFAVMRWIVSQLNRELEVIYECRDPVHELGATAVIFGAVVEIQNQTGDLWKA